MAVRLADIATQAGVSEATVSRVLNDKPGVAIATKQAVMTALDVLGYERPARLRVRSPVVGLVTPDLTNPIFAAFAQVIETLLAQSGYSCLLCTQSAGGVQEDDYLRMLLEQGVSGIIFVSGRHSDALADHQSYRRLRQRGLPIVLVNGRNDDLAVPSVSCDDQAASALAVEHLLALGHQRIGLAIGPERFAPARGKMAGYRQAMLASGPQPAAVSTEWIEQSLFTVEGGQAAALRLLDQECTAIVCGSDLMALGAIRAIRSRGLTVPGDVSVVGFDDSSLVAFTDPPLTTIWQPVQGMGEAAVRALLDDIHGQPAPQAEYTFRPELVVRDSTAIARPTRR
jgi:LacI family transcriptional regulator, repressor for deo operon, udp, cdd, tsx, nupC, and nupG